MLRYIFAFIILIHGLTHLLGFAKAFNYAEISQLTRPISKPNGVLWLLAALLFVAAAVLVAAKNKIWWVPALIGVFLSQILIVTVWSDAKFGTIANILILIVSIVGYGAWRFHSTTRKQLDSLLPATLPDRGVVTEETIARLPDVVKRWLRRSNVLGKEVIRSVFLRQKGEMRTTVDGKWMTVEAEQYCIVDKPGFVWIADVKMAPLVYLAGRDKYVNGKGGMLIQLFYLVPVVNSSGPEIDQGALLRYLGELVWFPTAAMSDYIRWEEIDSVTARATMNYEGVTASGIITFSPEGDMKSMEAMRYFDRKSGATLEQWQVEADPYGFREFGGIRIPAKFAVTWKLKEGDFTWYKFQLKLAQYNRL